MIQQGKKIFSFIITILSQYTGFSPRFMTFLFVGVLNTAFGYFLYVLFLFVGLHYAAAAFLSNIFGILFNFKTIGSFVFQNKNNRLIFKFFGVYAVCYVANITGLTLCKYFGLSNMYIAGAILVLPVALLGYCLNKNFVFTSAR